SCDGAKTNLAVKIEHALLSSQEATALPVQAPDLGPCCSSVEGVCVSALLCLHFISVSATRQTGVFAELPDFP
ncbi:hypothetical protein, partial [Nocardiopsis flavescens]|uniref:hypothetical protein n=1 Tax=Nocardiopsis flavescens TaxID=758803 RepID=UPI001C49E28B